jgi:transcriptional regulator
MYTPEDFKMEDPNEQLDFIQSNTFGTLISTNSTLEPLASHLPFYIRQKEPLVIEGHISRANNQCELLRNGKNAMLIFQGPNGYISSSVYGHENVPTWNYQAIHVYGTISLLNDQEMENHLADLMTLHESNRDNKKDFLKLPKKLIDDYKKEILCFRITAYRTEASYKLSQNRNKADHEAIIHDLEQKEDHAALVTAIKKHYKK